ncbi:hypothetical protein D3C81_1503010 [compost metagenome]
MRGRDNKVLMGHDMSDKNNLFILMPLNLVPEFLIKELMDLWSTRSPICINFVFPDALVILHLLETGFCKFIAPKGEVVPAYIPNHYPFVINMIRSGRDIPFELLEMAVEGPSVFLRVVDIPKIMITRYE